MMFGLTKGGKLRNITTHNEKCQASQEYFVFQWLYAHAMVDVTYVPAFFRASDLVSSSLLMPEFWCLLQHMRVHNNSVAMNYSFYELLMAPDSAPQEVRALRKRCLNPGMYAQHLNMWLDQFSFKQVGE